MIIRRPWIPKLICLRHKGVSLGNRHGFGNISARWRGEAEPKLRNLNQLVSNCARRDVSVPRCDKHYQLVEQVNGLFFGGENSVNIC